MFVITLFKFPAFTHNQCFYKTSNYFFLQKKQPGFFTKKNNHEGKNAQRGSQKWGGGVPELVEVRTVDSKCHSKTIGRQWLLL